MGVRKVRFLACLLLVLSFSTVSTTAWAASFDDLDAAMVAGHLDEARRTWEELSGQEGSQDFPARRHQDYGRLIEVLERGQKVLTVAEQTNDANTLNEAYQDFIGSWQRMGGSLAVSAAVLGHANATKNRVNASYQSAFTEIAEGRRTNSGGGTGEQEQADAPGLDFSALEDLLVADKLQEAGALWEEMGRGRGSPDFPYAEFNSYRDVFEILKGARAVLKTADDPAGVDKVVLDIQYGKYTKAWQEKAPKLGVNARLAGHLNETRDRVNEGYERALVADRAASEVKEAEEVEKKAKVETQAESIRELERLLMADRLVEARRLWEDLKRQGFEGRYWGKRNRFKEIFPVLEWAQKFRAAIEAYNGTTERWDTTTGAKIEFYSRWDRMVKDLPFDAEFVDYLNKTKNELAARYDELNIQREAKLAIVRKRKKDTKRRAEKYAEERARKQAEEDRRRRAEADRLRRKQQAERARREQARLDKLDTISNIAVEEGYKGLNKKAGIARFLIGVLRGGSLEAGLNQVFWTELDDQNKRLDNDFILTQFVDGWRNYAFVKTIGGELVSFTITVPGDGDLTMPGQGLKDGFYVYVGDREYTTVMGATRSKQIFRPVELNVE